jgi:flagellar biosynthetic protein FliR
MPGELSIPLGTLHAFLLVLFRVGGVFVFAPIPGMRVGPAPPRIVLAVGITLALYPKWPAPPAGNPEIGDLLAWGLSELALGLTVGLLVGFLIEVFALGAQALSLPAGYTYASTIDPSTEAESNVLVILAQLVGGLLFFGFGLHLRLILALARSLETYPPGQFGISLPVAEQVIALGSSIFDLGLQLVLPVLALLAMIDISLALLGRLNSQLQVIILSFPAKMLASLATLAALGSVMPRVFERASAEMLAVLYALLGLRAA